MEFLLQSDFVVPSVFILTLSVIALVTYLFGFKKTNVQLETTQKSVNVVKTKKEANTNSKKKQAVQAVVQQQPLVKQVVEEQVVKQVVKSQPAPVQQVKKETKKKQKVSQPAVGVVVEPVVVQEQVDQSDNIGWTTVVDKRQLKKQQVTAQTTDNQAEPESKSKTNQQDKAKPQVVESVPTPTQAEIVIGSKQSVEHLKTTLNELEKEVDEWIPANPKSKKSKSKKEAQSQNVAQVEVQVEPQPQLQTEIVLPQEVKTETKNSKKKKTNNNNNNNNNKKSELESMVKDAVLQVDSNNNSNSTNNNKKVNLKQTSLTDSIILVDKELASNASSKRTESNQSSIDSLQDVDDDEGFITITSKKSKKSVRREQ